MVISNSITKFAWIRVALWRR